MRKINFRSKAENLAEILQEVNLRPAKCRDDGRSIPWSAPPSGRQLPGVRVLGRHLYYLKRILLWSPETQTARDDRGIRPTKPTWCRRSCSANPSAKRSRTEEFLQTLRLRVVALRPAQPKDVHLNRALELFNKTNQFNTTGGRYTLEQCHELLRRRVATVCH